MACTVNNIRDIDGTKQWVHITLEVDGDEVKYTTVQPWNTNTPVLEGADLEAFCNGREDTYKLEILKSMYPNARYQDTEGDTELDKFTNWIAAGHTNAAYCKGAEGSDGATCTTNGGQWFPEEEVTKVPFTNSHSYIGDMRTRKLEELNQDLRDYLYGKYDIGTQMSLKETKDRDDTPAEIKASLDGLYLWILSVMGYYYTKKAAIRDAVDDSWQTETWDFSQFDATDPKISLEALMGG